MTHLWSGGSLLQSAIPTVITHLLLCLPYLHAPALEQEHTRDMHKVTRPRKNIMIIIIIIIINGEKSTAFQTQLSDSR